MDFPGSKVVKNLPANAGDARDMGSIPGSGRSPGVGNGNPLQFSCLENSMDRGAWLQSMGSQRVRHSWLTNYHTTLTYLDFICKSRENWIFDVKAIVLEFPRETLLSKACISSIAFPSNDHVTSPWKLPLMEHFTFQDIPLICEQLRVLILMKFHSTVFRN